MMEFSGKIRFTCLKGKIRSRNICMKNQTVMHSGRRLSLTIIIGIAVIIGAALTWKNVTAHQQDKIEYNQVYECRDGAKFKVLSCAGPGKFDSCETFAINELS